MTIHHHLDSASLMSCASGSQPAAPAAVISAHLALCPECMANLATAHRIGVALFDNIKPLPVKFVEPHLDKPVELATITPPTTPGQEKPSQSPAPEIPPPIAIVVGSCLDELTWEVKGPGAWVHHLQVTDRAHGALSLVKLAPGVSARQAGVEPQSLSIVLRGSYQCPTGTFRRGDVADLEDFSTHTPIADSEVGCIYLMAQ